MLNSITLIGRMTRAPELRYTQSQKPVASFTLAVERDYAGEGGTRPVDFIDCVAWNSAALFADKYFDKGMMAAVSGRLQLRDWTDRDGNKRRNAEVLVSNIYFTGDRKKDAAAPPEYALPEVGDATGEYDGPDGNLPF